MLKSYLEVLATAVGDSFLDTEYVYAAEVSQVPVGTLKKVALQDKEVLLVNVDGVTSAIDNVCPHLGGDLSLGSLEGSVLTCPRHQAKFDATTGRAIAPPQVSPYSPKIPNLTAYPVKIEEQKILIKIASK
jgi:3-phenylpropionate/trans-cinnamate dioxygenase ferredoxin component